MDMGFLRRGAAALITAYLLVPTDGLAASKCREEEGLKSPDVTPGSSEITFNNNTAHKRHVYWIDSRGHRDLGAGGVIPANNSMSITSYAGQLFVVTNSLDNCIGVYGVDSAPRTVDLN